MRTKPERNPLWSDADRAALARLIAEEYRRFVADPDADTKAFAARHAAGKGALAHLDLLMKSGGRGEEEPGDAVANHLDAARAAVASLEGEADPDDDDAGDDG